ncbi:MAG TPA: WD40 repeat domain-containing protein [Gemmataceae bacterium]|nr:WD40 repeat domain-containing protein [Gemmataceae bacterium]
MLRRPLFVSAGLLLSLAWLADLSPAQPPAKDQHGDKLPAGAIARLGTLRWRHDGIIHFAAFLPDGKSIISVGEDQKARIWDFPSGIEMRQIDLVPKKEKQTTVSRAPDMISAALTKDGKFIAMQFSNRVALASDKTPVRVHDIASGKEIASLEVGRESYASLYFSPDDQHLVAIGAKGDVAIWNRTTWQKVADLKPSSTTSSSLAPKQNPKIAFSPDGKNAVIVGQSRSLTVLEVSSGKEDSASGGGPLQAIQYGPDGKHIYTISGSGKAKWDVATGKHLGAVGTQNSKTIAGITRPQVSPDGKVVAGVSSAGNFGAGNYALVFADASTGQVIASHKIGSADITAIITTLTFSPSGAMVAVSVPQTAKVELLESPSAKLLRSLTLNAEGAKGSTTAMATTLFSPDGKILLTRLDAKNIELWDTATGRRVGALQMPTGNTINQWMFSSDQRCLITNMSDGTVIAYEMVTLQSRRSYGIKK